MDVEENTHRTRELLVDVIIGGLIGGLFGAVVAINFVLVVGVEQGYEASLGEVFEHNVVAGAITLALLVAGPFTGVVAARRRRRLARETTGDQVEARNG